MQVIQDLFQWFEQLATYISTHPIVIPLVFSIVAFVLGLVLSQRSDITTRSFVAALIAVGMWMIAPYARDALGTNDRHVFNTFIAIGAEVFGGICLVALGAEMTIWEIVGARPSPRAIIYRVLSTAALLGLGWLFIAWADSGMVRASPQAFPLIAYSDKILGAASVEVLASALVNVPLLLLAYFLYSLMLLVEKPALGGLLLLVLLALGVVCVVMLQALPERTLTAAFPRSLGMSCAGALISVGVNHVWKMIRAHEDMAVFSLITVSLIAVAGVLLLTGTNDESFDLSAATEIFGIVVMVALLDEHPFSRRQFRRRGVSFSYGD